MGGQRTCSLKRTGRAGRDLRGGIRVGSRADFGAKKPKDYLPSESTPMDEFLRAGGPGALATQTHIQQTLTEDTAPREMRASGESALEGQIGPHTLWVPFGSGRWHGDTLAGRHEHARAAPQCR